MSGVQEQFEIKFRLPDGTDIGPRRFPPASTVATLKETIIAQWPKGESPYARTRFPSRCRGCSAAVGAREKEGWFLAPASGAGAVRLVLARPSLSWVGFCPWNAHHLVWNLEVYCTVASPSWPIRQFQG